MGSVWSRIRSRSSSQSFSRLLMLGLDSSGKTTILYKLHLGLPIQTIPTVSCNVETFNYKNTKITIRDLGGQVKIRPLWVHYLSDATGIIYVVDSMDRSRMDLAREELANVVSETDMTGRRLLIYANKQDIPNAMAPGEIAERLGLSKITNSFLWYVQPCCAITGEGLFQGLDWISSKSES